MKRFRNAINIMEIIAELGKYLLPLQEKTMTD